MQASFRLHIAHYQPEARESTRLPADCSYRIAYAQARCWRGNGWWVAEQWYDARQAYPYFIEIHTTKTLRFAVQCLRRDLHWLYPLSGGFTIYSRHRRVEFRLVADEHVRVLAGVASHEVEVRPGRHLLFAFVLNWGWTRRYARGALSYLRLPLPIPITPAIRGHLLTLANLSAHEGLVMDAEIYWPIARITHATRQLYAAYDGVERSVASTLQLAQSARNHIRETLALGGRVPAVSEVAAHLNVTADHLSRVHKQHYGKRLQAYLMQQRLDTAYQLLSEEGLNVSAVTYRLGFSDVQAFNKLFRKYFGVAPSSVRKG